MDAANESATPQEIIEYVCSNFVATDEVKKCPHESTIRRYIAKYPSAAIWPKKFGTIKARNLSRVSKGPIRADRPLQIVQFDSTTKDLFSVDGKEIGRLQITWAIDVYSRAILGYELSISPRSQLTSLEAYKCMVMPKCWVKVRFEDLEMYWPQHGRPEILVVDRGPEHGASFRTTLALVGTTVQYNDPGSPWKNGIIEALNRKLKKHFQTELGSIHRDPKFRNPKRGAKVARLSHHDVERKILEFIRKHNSEQAHGTAERPNDRWLEAVKDRPVRPALSGDEMELLTAMSVEVHATHNGIRWKHIQYTGEALERIYLDNNEARPGERKKSTAVPLEAKIYPRDVSSIYILDPQGRTWLQLNAVNKEQYEGVSVQQHRAIVELAKLVAKKREGAGFANIWSEKDYLDGKRQVVGGSIAIPKRGLASSARAAVRAAIAQKSGANGATRSPIGTSDRTWLNEQAPVRDVEVVAVCDVTEDVTSTRRQIRRPIERNLDQPRNSERSFEDVDSFQVT